MALLDCGIEPHWSHHDGSADEASLSNRCAFFQSAGTAIDAQGNRYVQMTTELVVQDRLGSRSNPVQRAIKLYPNRLCGYTY